MWDFESHAAARLFDQSKEEDTIALVFAPDGKLLSTSGDDRLVKFWDAASGKQVFSLPGHQAHVTAIAYSPDGRTLATGCEDHSIKLWDLVSRQQLLILLGHRTPDVGLFFRPDGGQLISVGQFDGAYSEIHVWGTQPDASKQ
jgi:WD40 repeat protein